MGEAMVNTVYKVQKVFQLQDRLVVVSDAVSDFPGLKHGGTVKLKCPDGRVHTTKVWFEMAWPTSETRPVSFSVEPKLQKSDIPEGTEILIDKEATKELDAQKRHTA
ncbi:MAG: hypothetical protein K8F91_00965 [Candidatus Obscuribacterales bacterium]|nr:hypothetical protein [Candidatus Obscuribacterales bacterium]